MDHPTAYRILLVDDEKDILEFIGYNLKKEGYEVYSATNGKDAIRMAGEILPHLILLDVMMPGMDGMETCEEMRKDARLNQTIIAFLTARGEDYSQIAGFEAGGDDYITKPIKPKVLLSRIRALLKRSSTGPVHTMSGKRVIQHKDITVDRERFTVVKKGKEIALLKKEFELLSLLMEKPGKVYTRDEIFQRVWGEKIIVGDRTIDVHIRKLRGRLGDRHIKTVKGVGYKFQE